MIWDGIDNIVTGKGKISDWDDVIKKWKSSGGDAIAAELATEYAKTH
jgi:putative aldouronate transport system substrate-binding protein